MDKTTSDINTKRTAIVSVCLVVILLISYFINHVLGAWIVMILLIIQIIGGWLTTEHVSDVIGGVTWKLKSPIQKEQTIYMIVTMISFFIGLRIFSYSI